MGKPLAYVWNSRWLILMFWHFYWQRAFQVWVWCEPLASGGDAGCVVVCALGILERCEHSMYCMCDCVPLASWSDVGKARGILSGVG